MKRPALLLVALAILAIASALWGAGAASAPSPQTLKVMTWNVYIGTDFSAVLAADSISQMLDAMGFTFDDVRGTRFQQRAKAIADHIQSSRPHLIGLQEVALWRTDNPPDGPVTPATRVEFDFLEILLDELQSRGLRYDVVDVFNGFDIEAPGRLSDGIRDVRFTDRDAVLARHTSALKIDSVRTRAFSAKFNLRFGPLGTFGYPRGWTSVDCRLNGKRFRFVNTHLDAFSNSTNVKQARELIDGPLRTSRPLIFVGDINSPAHQSAGQAYRRFVNAGLVDAWTQAHAGGAGNTCCQDTDLRNDQSELSSRIDLIFARGNVDVRSVKRIGASQGDRTPSGLWPSDHAGVRASLRLN
jgi:endonuclease/exonuclease/phosphatase family metal-dependent hydrolase